MVRSAQNKTKSFHLFTWSCYKRSCTSFACAFASKWHPMWMHITTEHNICTVFKPETAHKPYFYSRLCQTSDIIVIKLITIYWKLTSKHRQIFNCCHGNKHFEGNSGKYNIEIHGVQLRFDYHAYVHQSSHGILEENMQVDNTSHFFGQKGELGYTVSSFFQDKN